MTATINSTEVLGARLLREIAAEEGSLEDLLKDLCSSLPSVSKTGLPDLDNLWKQHGSKLNITGRALPLLYHLLHHLIHTLHGTLVLLDLSGRFSPSHLTHTLTYSELTHIHILHPSKENLKITLESVEGYMLYGNHGSKGREWLGTIVVGGTGGGVNLGWRGWLRVEREMVGAFGEGCSVEEAWEEKARRGEVVDEAGWRGVAEEGEVGWK